MEVQGTIKKIGLTKEFNEKFRKREVVLTIDGKYPQDVIFEVNNDMCEVLDEFREYEMVKATFNLRGREWTSPQGEVKYFNTLQIWNIDKIVDESVVKLNNKSNFVDDTEEKILSEGNDLPF